MFKYVHGHEYHAYNPDVVMSLQAAVQEGSYTKWKKFAQLVNERPVATIRDLLKLKPAETPIALEEVEPVEELLPRFDSSRHVAGSAIAGSTRSASPGHERSRWSLQLR